MVAIKVWWLYLFLGSMGTIMVPDPFDTKGACMRHGDKQVLDFKQLHTRSPAYRWCMLGNVRKPQ